MFLMLTDIDKNMMIKFLEKNYHVSRIKHNMRFRRGIMFDDGKSYLLGDNSQELIIKHKLIDLIKLLFSCDDETSTYIVNSYLHTK
jgi:hypothetical protein